MTHYEAQQSSVNSPIPCRLPTILFLFPILFGDNQVDLAAILFTLFCFAYAAKEFETEILRLKRLLAENNDTNNYAAVVPPETITEVIQKQTPVSPARTPVWNRTNTVQSSVNAICPPW